jgi:hypothetical protein
MRGPWRHFTDERGIASVMAIFIMVMLLVSGIFLVRMSSTEGDIAYGTMWAEGSFFAADAAVNVGFDQVTPANTNPAAQSLNFTGVNLGAFNPSGTITFTGTRPVQNSSMCSGTGYGSCGGYAYFDYAISGSGTGPKSAQRTADARVSYGPVSQ